NRNRSGCQSGLGLRYYGCKTGLIVDGHIGQYFTIQFDRGFFSASDEHTVCNTQFAAGRVDTGDPQSAESALLVAAVAVGILPGAHDRLFGDAKDITAATAIAFCCFNDFFVTSACSDAAF